MRRASAPSALGAAALPGGAVRCTALLLALQACGGGGDGAASDPVASAAPVPTASTSSADATCGLADFEADALRLINQRRAAGATCGARGSFAPAPALVVQAQLTRAAAGHARDMADKDYFSHSSLDGRTMADRVGTTGYDWRALGENIAAGYATVRQTIDGWMASEGHCANLMNADFTEFGLACARNDASRYRSYWTLDLGRR